MRIAISKWGRPAAALATILATPAVAHDFGYGASTAEAQVLEAPLSSEPENSDSRATVHSFMAGNLTWSAGELSVCFWNGSEALRQRVADIADELVENRPVRFRWKVSGAFVTCPEGAYAPYVIRVSLAPVAELVPGDNPNQYFAAVGRRLLGISRKANLNLPFPGAADDTLVRSKTLHEFCHALGCLHEHQRGACDEDFDRDAIMANYTLTPSEYDANFKRIPSTDAFYRPNEVGTLDVQSIMMYRFYPWMFKQGVNSPCLRDYEVTQLSAGDRAGLDSVYPAAAPLPRSVADFDKLEEAFDARAVAAAIEARALRGNSISWALTSPAFGGQAASDVRRQFEMRAQSAEAEAQRYRDLAELYDITDETKSKLQAAMSLLGR